MEVVFARTRYDYPSYEDFWALVAVSGYPICFVDEIRLDEERVFITTPCNGETFPHLDNEHGRCGSAHAAKVVWWNLERQDYPDAPPIPETISGALERFDDIWVSDQHYRNLDPRMRYVLMGSHRDLYWASNCPHLHDWDFCHYSYAWGRRRALYDELVGAGLREAPGAWTPEDKAHVVSRSAVMLSAHQYEQRLVAPIRFAVAAAFGVPLVSELLEEPGPFVKGVHLVTAHFSSIVGVVGALAASPTVQRQLGGALHDLLCREWTFRRSVDQALAEGVLA